MIKKFLSCLCTLLMILNMFVVVISADTASELETLFDTAFRRYTSLHNGPMSCGIEENSYLQPFFEYRVMLKENGAGIELDDFHRFYEFYFESFSDNPSKPIVTLNTVEDATNFVSECFTDELTKKFITLELNGKTYSLFQANESGKVLIYYKPYVGTLRCVYDNFRNVEIKGDSASALLTLWCFTIAPEIGEGFFGPHLDGDPCFLPTTATVEFTKTADGWRVSGGTAFEVMLEDREPNFNPSTGDTSSYTAPALTVAAIISVALPVTLLRKRRRVV